MPKKFHIGKSKKKRTFMPQLHTHDDHSIKDGCSPVETYADRVVELGGGSLAITNHGRAAGFARQYFACKDRGIKPIFGMEAYVNEHRRKPVQALIADLKAKKKAKKAGAADNLARAEAFRKEQFRPNPHAIVLAKNHEGYRNLVRMSTDSWVNGRYYAPRTDTKFLAEHREGLIYSTACIGGYIPKLVRGNWHRGVEEARRLKAIFGDDFYVETMMTEYDAQRETNRLMLKLAHEIGAKVIVTCDVHYCEPAAALAQDVLLLMRDDKTLADRDSGSENVWQFEAKDLWWRSLEDVVECWRGHHADYFPKDEFAAAIKNTYALADGIEEFEFNTDLKLPGVFERPEATLKELVRSGFKWRSDHGDVPASGRRLRDYAVRIKRELDVIVAKGFSEYFLVLHDICDHARSIGSRMGPGRGSAGGSLIAYLLRITEIDPLRFNLLFERFLAVDRPDPPDIDLDFSPGHRNSIKTYVESRYPATATIGSMSTFKPRATLQKVGKVFGIDYREMIKVTKPLGTDADDMTWDEIFDQWETVAKFSEDHPDAFAVVKVLRGLISHTSQSAAGFLVGPASSLDEIPMRVDKNGELVTAFADTQGDGVDYEGRELSRLGCLKVDILGIRNVDFAPRAVEILTRETGETVDLERLPLDDPTALAVATTGDVPGIFQLDTSVTKPILRQVGVDDFADLVMITALARPGPLKHNIHRDYARLKRSDRWRDDVPESLREVLSDSRGLMILQEDVMWVAQAVAGFDFVQANALRKIISKKQPEALALWKDRFVGGGVEQGGDESELEETWRKIVTFAGYGFCKAHAVAYMITAYRQIYMLAHHPLCWFAALLAETPRSKKNKRDDSAIAGFMRAAMARGVPVLGPSVVRSRVLFDAEGESVRYGLSSIKGVASAAEFVVAARPFSTFEELFDKVERRKVNKTKFEALILSGALDDLPFEANDPREPIEVEEGIERRNALLHKLFLLRYEGKKLKEDDRPERHPPLTLRERERELLGLALSWWASKEKDRLREELNLTTINDCLVNDCDRLALCAEVASARTHKGARGTMGFLVLADETGELENVVVWADQLKENREKLRKGRLVVIRLVRRENPPQRRRYGMWSYHLDGRAPGGAVESVARALRSMG